MKSIMVGIRFKEDIYQALQARAGQGSVADYIRELATKSVNSPSKQGVNSNPAPSAIATNPVKPDSTDQPVLYLDPVRREVPFYDPLIHKPGDRVWIWQNGAQTEIVVPGGVNSE